MNSSLPTITPKKLEEYDTLKESSQEVKLLVDIYERRIAELNAIIEKLLDKDKVHSVPHLERVVTEPLATKPKFTTMSQVVAEMEKRTRLGEKK